MSARPKPTGGYPSRSAYAAAMANCGMNTAQIASMMGVSRGAAARHVRIGQAIKLSMIWTGADARAINALAGSLSMTPREMADRLIRVLAREPVVARNLLDEESTP